MASIRHLKNAPITEAIVDFRVKPSPDFQAKQFLDLKKTINDQFPKSKEHRIIKGGIKFKDGKPESQFAEDQGIQGYLFMPEDEKKVAQFRIDGFTFSRLKPYSDWEELRNEARSLWKIYLDLTNPEAIARVAVRYINHIELALPIDDLSSYLTAPPKVPDNTPGAISGFLSRIMVYNREGDVAANIIQALDKSTRPDRSIIVILDIDAFKKGDFKDHEHEMWDAFEELHTFKNQIFFNSITEKTARLFE